MSPIGIRLAGVRKSFRSGTSGAVVAVRPLDLRIGAGEFVVLVGHNGCGKSTLLGLLSGEVALDAGAVLAVDAAGTESPLKQQSTEDRKVLVASVFQDPRRNIVPELTVAENLALVMMDHSRPSPLRRAISPLLESRLEPALARVGLKGKLRERAGALSHGQQQLLALEMVLRRRPSVLLLDEPTASLDRQNAERCLAFVEVVWRETQATLILVTHDLAAAMRLGTRLVTMRDGEISGDFDATARRTLSLTDLLTVCGLTS